MKLEIGKRYVTRDGRTTNPLEYTSGNRYPFSAVINDGGGRASWTDDGQWSVSMWEGRLDLVAEYVEPVTSIDIVFKSSDFHRAGTNMYDHAIAGKCAGWSKATLFNITPIEHVVEEPVFPEPPAGWLYYGIGPVKELPLHYTHEHVLVWSESRKNWCVGHGDFSNYRYAVKSGTHLAILCGLEKLKLASGKRYVLTDGRITTELLLASKHPFCVGVDGKAHYVHADGSVWYTSAASVGQISHPAEQSA